MERPYSLSVGFAVNGNSLVDEDIPVWQLVGQPFSIEQAAVVVVDFLDQAFALPNVIDFLQDSTSNVVFGANSVSGDFDVTTSDFDIISVLAGLACGHTSYRTFTSTPCATDGTFGLDVALTYEMAPVPLPAALPLLAVGLGGLGLVARRRARS